MQTGAATVENTMEFPQIPKMELPFDPAIPLLGLYPKNPETPIQKNPMHPNVHSLTIYNSQVLEAIEVHISKLMYKKLCFVYTMEYYAA